MSMTPEEWQAEVCRRIAINEGCRLTMYHDSVGVPTIGIGYNLLRADARTALAAIGADLDKVMAGAAITRAQAEALFGYSFKPILSEAHASIDGFDNLSDARRFVICDLVFNLGFEGWMGFGTTRSLIESALAEHDPAKAHALYGQAADHLAGSLWAQQVGNRAKRDCAMMRSSEWVDAYGDGSY